MRESRGARRYEEVPVVELLAAVLAQRRHLDPGASWRVGPWKGCGDGEGAVAVFADAGCEGNQIDEHRHGFRQCVLGRDEAQSLEAIDLAVGRWGFSIELRILTVGDDPTVMPGELDRRQRSRCKAEKQGEDLGEGRRRERASWHGGDFPRRGEGSGYC